MVLSPADYSRTSTADLLAAAARGEAGVDHRWLGAILERGEAAVDEFLPFLEADRQADLVDLGQVLLDIARHLQTPRAAPFLATLARILEYDLPDDLLQAFLPLGEAAVEPLLELYEESDGAVDISFALSSLGVRDPRILDLLVAELDEFPVEAAISLSRYGDPASKPAVEAALRSSKDETAKFALKAALEEIGRREPEPPEPFDIWEKYPKTALPEFDFLDTGTAFAFLDSPEAEYRAAAAANLSHPEPDDDLPIEKIDARLFELARTDPDPTVRGECWAALATVADNEEIASEMMARFANPDVPAEERGGVLYALAPAAEESEHVRQAILDLAEDPAGRRWALSAMGTSEYAGFGDVVPRFMDDPDLIVRRTAIQAAAGLKVVSARDRMRELIGDPDVRDLALEAYIDLAPGEVDPDTMRDLLEEVEEIAGGLDQDEAEMVRSTLDAKLAADGFEPTFMAEIESEDDEDELVEDPFLSEAQQPFVTEPQQPIVKPAKIGRNDPCPCGSGKKYKKCCGQ